MYLDENSDIPKEMQSLVEKLLKIETLPGSSKEGIDKLYDQIFEQFIPNSDLVIIKNMRHLIEEEILDQFKAKLKHHLLS